MTIPTVDLDLDRIEASARGELGAKSLGEKLFDANATLTGTGFRWRDLHVTTHTDHEKVALAFAASLTHDETANAITLSLISALRASEAERERLVREAPAFAAKVVEDVTQRAADVVVALTERATTAEALAKEQAEALDRYGAHAAGCKALSIRRERCSCGFDAALSRTRPSGGDADGGVG